MNAKGLSVATQTLQHCMSIISRSKSLQSYHLDELQESQQLEPVVEIGIGCWQEVAFSGMDIIFL